MIKSIDRSTVHRISSGQVLVDLQTVVKELVENSLDAGATNIEVRLRDHGIASIEVIDNGSGIAPEDYDHVARKHHTSKLSSFEDLSTITSFGFRGEALSSLCALSENVTITTATSKEEPLGTVLELDKTGALVNRSKTVARRAGTTVLVEGLFKPLPVRRKELERNAKREFAKALNLLNAYALVPCAKENKGVRLSVFHQPEGGKRTLQLRSDGHPSTKSSISALWGPKQVESLVELDIKIEVLLEKAVLRRRGLTERERSIHIAVRGFISKFTAGNGRSSSDRQYFYINGRPCNPTKIQKTFNEVYKSFNANQSPFVVADFLVPTDSYDINVSPDKRTILMHSENSLVAALKESLEKAFAPSRSTFTVQTQLDQGLLQAVISKSPAGGIDGDNFDSSTTSHQDSGGAPVSSSMGEPHLLLQSEGSSASANESDVVMAAPVSDEPESRMNEQQDVDKPSTDQSSASSVRNVAPKETSQLPLFLETEEAGRSVDDNTYETRSTTTRNSNENVLLSTPPTRPRSPPSLASPVTRPSSHPPSRAIQLILDTSNASWNVRRPQAKDVARMGMVMSVESSSGGRPFKRLKTDGPSYGSSSGTSTRLGLREQLACFAKKGSVVKHMGDEENGEDEGDSETEVQENGEGVEVEEMNDDRIDFMNAQDTKSNCNGTEIGTDEDSTAKNYTARDYANPIVVEEAITVADSSPEGALGNNMICPEDGLHPGNGDFAELLPLNKKTSTNRGIDNGETAPSGPLHPPEVLRTVSEDGSISITFDLDKLTRKWNYLSLNSDSEIENASATNSSPNIFKPETEEAATQQLSRVIHKKDFEHMTIVGQFNLGFIIARNMVLVDGSSGEQEQAEATQTSMSNTEIGALDDLFIIDQHAADEKYNFETLQAETKMESQRLFVPRPLELTAAEELAAIENMDILQSNGFQIAVDEELGPGQGRVKLVAQPVSKNTTFDIKDLEELLHLLQDHTPVASNKSRATLRCSKVRAMFAMRACRKSIMIGKPLTKNQMTMVVKHMGTMDQPWNCPHGRPTMRHLVNLNGVAAPETYVRPVKWTNLRN